MTDQLFYIQDGRDYAVGNYVVFWAKNGMGYTTDISKAQVYTKKDALVRHRHRETDIPWPKNYIDARTRPTVDMQYVEINEALKDTGIELINPRQ